MRAKSEDTPIPKIPGTDIDDFLMQKDDGTVMAVQDLAIEDLRGIVRYFLHREQMMQHVANIVHSLTDTIEGADQTRH